MTLALDLEQLPDPPAAAIPWLFAGVVLAWLALRVAILRRQLATAAPGEPPPSASAFLLALARSRASLPLLVLLIGACAVAIVLAFG